MTIRQRLALTVVVAVVATPSVGSAVLAHHWTENPITGNVDTTSPDEVTPDPTPTPTETPEPTPTPEPSTGIGDPAFPDVTLTPCATEDSSDCYWNAATMGNGEGRSFVNLNGTRYVADGPSN